MTQQIKDEFALGKAEAPPFTRGSDVRKWYIAAEKEDVVSVPTLTFRLGLIDKPNNRLNRYHLYYGEYLLNKNKG